MKLNFRKRKDKRSYQYTLPQDAVNVQAEGKSWAMVLILQDFLQQTVIWDRAALEAACRKQIEDLQATVRQNNKQELTNDLEEFCRLLVPAYCEIYEGLRTRYQGEPGFLERDARVTVHMSLPDRLILARKYWGMEAEKERSYA